MLFPLDLTLKTRQYWNDFVPDGSYIAMMTREPLPPALQHFPFRLIQYLLPDESLVPTEGQKIAWQAACQRADPVADQLVAAFKQQGRIGREQFDQALTQGIEHVQNPLPELVAYFKALEETPFWVDRRQLRIAQEALMRVSPEALFVGVLAFGLPASYVASKVNQTLIRAGGLQHKAAKRAVETTGWIMHCLEVGGLERFALGFQGIAQVRLVHAFMRAGLSHHPEWDVPINQAQYALTLMPFIVSTLMSIPMGNWMSPREVNAIFHLWRTIGHLMGIEPELQITHRNDLIKMFWLTGWTEIKPDPYTPQLNQALQAAVPVVLGLPSRGRWAKPVQWITHQTLNNLGRMVVGRHYGNALGIPPLNAMSGVVAAAAVIRLAYDLPHHVIPGANARRIARNQLRHRKFLAAASARVQADLHFNRDHAPLHHLQTNHSR